MVRSSERRRLRLNGYGRLKLYVDGVAQHDGDGLAAEYTPTAEPLRIGVCRGVKSYFTGDLDEVRFYKRALTERDVKNLYAQ